MAKKSLLLSAILIATIGANAQTTSTFDNLTLPSADTSFLETQITDGDYSFESGNAKFIGSIQYGGTYQTKFNYSNRQNDTTNSYTNQWSAIAAAGVNSTNYGIAYLESDYTNFNISQILGFNLVNAAAENPILGTYINNSTWGYLWMKENFAAGEYLKLTATGYLNGTVTDETVETYLANYAQDTILIKDWTWLDLTPLGNVDSVTFQMASNNSSTPYYLAFDNLITSDGICPDIDTLILTSIIGNSANFEWTTLGGSFVSRYEFAVDEQNTPEPNSGTIVSPVFNPSFTEYSLSNNKVYYAHVRAACSNNTYSPWYVIRFATGTTSINDASSQLDLQLAPNPATDFITINDATITTIEVYSIDGKLVATHMNTNIIPVQSLANGTYFLKATNKAGETGHQKFVKQ